MRLRVPKSLSRSEFDGNWIFLNLFLLWICLNLWVIHSFFISFDLGQIKTRLDNLFLLLFLWSLCSLSNTFLSLIRQLTWRKMNDAPTTQPGLVYLQDYLDIIESLPTELSRNYTKLKELDYHSLGLCSHLTPNVNRSNKETQRCHDCISLQSRYSEPRI